MKKKNRAQKFIAQLVDQLSNKELTINQMLLVVFNELENKFNKIPPEYLKAWNELIDGVNNVYNRFESIDCLNCNSKAYQLIGSNYFKCENCETIYKKEKELINEKIY